MRVPRSGAGLALACVGLLLALTGCRQTADGRPQRPVTYPSSPIGHGAMFLGAGDCSTRGTVFREVPCTSERAVARVTTRYQGATSGGPTCPATTDFVLHVAESRPAADENGDGTVPRGYACMRNLEPPHPGDPGEGGGPHTIVGDCVSASSEGRVKETACDGSGADRPAFRVASAVTCRDRCPPSTALFVALGGERPVGCARRL
ncbi:hypothetical protein ACFU51_16960 [Streptomyces sp. NPDC057430]|uniref:hypothetical protein n=1 Tax=Streptomyces sp. NPDC057430 TaxID=3346131 RepID=UPI0036D05868